MKEFVPPECLPIHIKTCAIALMCHLPCVTVMLLNSGNSYILTLKAAKKNCSRHILLFSLLSFEENKA